MISITNITQSYITDILLEHNNSSFQLLSRNSRVRQSQYKISGNFISLFIIEINIIIPRFILGYIYYYSIKRLNRNLILPSAPVTMTLYTTPFKNKISIELRSFYNSYFKKFPQSRFPLVSFI